MTNHAFEPARLSTRLPATVDAPALARRELDGWLPASITDGDRGALRLLVTELVTNSVRHAGAERAVVGIDAEIAGGVVMVRVSDQGAGFERAPGTPKPRGASGGYGLFLVERMASRWGVERANGTRVWFELALSPPSTA